MPKGKLRDGGVGPAPLLEELVTGLAAAIEGRCRSASGACFSSPVVVTGCGGPRVRVVRWRGDWVVGSAARPQLVESADRVDTTVVPGARSDRCTRVLPAVWAMLAGIGEQAVSESFGFPASGLVAGEGERPHPGEQVGCLGDSDGAPDLDGREG